MFISFVIQQVYFEKQDFAGSPKHIKKHYIELSHLVRTITLDKQRHKFLWVMRTHFLEIKLVFIYFSVFYLLSLFIISLIFWKNHLFLTYGSYMKHNQDKICLMSYDSPLFDDMKYLAYGVSRHYLLQSKWRHLPLKNFDTPFKFDLYGIQKTFANFDALVIICTIIHLKAWFSLWVNVR